MKFLLKNMEMGVEKTQFLNIPNKLEKGGYSSRKLFAIPGSHSIFN